MRPRPRDDEATVPLRVPRCAKALLACAVLAFVASRASMPVRRCRRDEHDSICVRATHMSARLVDLLLLQKSMRSLYRDHSVCASVAARSARGHWSLRQNIKRTTSDFIFWLKCITRTHEYTALHRRSICFHCGTLQLTLHQNGVVTDTTAPSPRPARAVAPLQHYSRYSTLQRYSATARSTVYSTLHP